MYVNAHLFFLVDSKVSQRELYAKLSKMERVDLVLFYALFKALLKQFVEKSSLVRLSSTSSTRFSCRSSADKNVSACGREEQEWALVLTL